MIIFNIKSKFNIKKEFKQILVFFWYNLIEKQLKIMFGKIKYKWN